ncbi:Mediator of RNA polymerase II transcription subunit 11 [Yamadazyma tenuis]|uniref:Mediator of RNA polymerase II transcription subunit 11 n=1 Tax=Candida tenuis (strain ATCC 10573 / BCRC 21748 / CBS 615 / JCM 9827 / NBRC 10315 / NRRL Y-1498 / VKM Y-70) TaxID=590646 RepID=G3BFG7_CANTC|nr:uncharacterized protein CANTEDRAFT_96130 [Yamadazyma tenuis ATCC 10573]EGV60688.1 hypothetical protein CANTEDRAFT_96130 [Yamadazyma tenuis ATCC 10573]WEJ94060.1 Mediator of RNA polymerase II transcription subunit 11 [Yamadazyma tenuis]
MSNGQFIQQRLDSLNDIDSSIVSLLGYMSDIFDRYSTPSNNSDDAKDTIETQTRLIYQTLSDIAINLRKEVKIMDDNTGVFDKNEDQVMILPIPVDQKNTALGKRRLNEEIDLLTHLIPQEPTEDQKFKPEPETVEEESVKEEPVEEEPVEEEPVKEEQPEEKNGVDDTDEPDPIVKPEADVETFGISDVEMEE